MDRYFHIKLQIDFLHIPIIRLISLLYENHRAIETIMSVWYNGMDYDDEEDYTVLEKVKKQKAITIRYIINLLKTFFTKK